MPIRLITPAWITASSKICKHDPGETRNLWTDPRHAQRRVSLVVTRLKWQVQGTHRSRLCEHPKPKQPTSANLPQGDNR